MSTTTEPAQCLDRPTLAHDAPSQGARPRVTPDRTFTGDRSAAAGPGSATGAEQRDETAYVEDWII